MNTSLPTSPCEPSIHTSNSQPASYTGQTGLPHHSTSGILQGHTSSYHLSGFPEDLLTAPVPESWDLPGLPDSPHAFVGVLGLVPCLFLDPSRVAKTCTHLLDSSQNKTHGTYECRDVSLRSQQCVASEVHVATCTNSLEIGDRLSLKFKLGSPWHWPW